MYPWLCKGKEYFVLHPVLIVIKMEDSVMCHGILHVKLLGEENNLAGTVECGTHHYLEKRKNGKNRN